METCNGNILLSFVIPVYNVESYLAECLDSILQCLTEECEIVLVNDGSTDASAEICERYADKYSCVKLLHKENGGLSSARNAGIAISRGKYITFVDSDDRIYPESITEILRWIRTSGADLCFLQAVKLYSDNSCIDLGEGIVGSEIQSKNQTDAVLYLASRSKYPGSAWSKLYRKEFLISNNLCFPHDRRYSEDLGFVRDCIIRAKTFDALDTPYYQYRQNRKGSITNSISTKNFNDLLCFISESADKLTENKKANDPVSKYAMSFVAYEYSVLLLLYSLIPAGDRKDALEKMRQYKWTLRYALNDKGRLVSLFTRLFGLKFTAFIIRIHREIVAK